MVSDKFRNQQGKNAKMLSKSKLLTSIMFFLTIFLFLIFPIRHSLAQEGRLQFYANGEELIVAGFKYPHLTKDGWELNFEHVYVTLTEITAWQSKPPYDAHKGGNIKGVKKVALPGIHTVDLTKGTLQNPAVLVGELTGVPSGHYNTISWRMAKATSGPAKGYSLLVTGSAKKNGKIIPFRIVSDNECEYRCGEFVGDVRKGFVGKGSVADLEMTFHFDHVFGRADEPLNSEMNKAAFGFEPFAGKSSAPRVIKLSAIHLGHVGEGHCAFH